MLHIDAMANDVSLTSSSSIADGLVAPRSDSLTSTTMLAGTSQGHTHIVNGGSSKADTLPNLGDLDTKCGGCQKTIDQESGGVVVAFG